MLHCKFFEFLKLIFCIIFEITNFWKFPNWFFFYFPNYKFLELPKLKIFEFSKFEVFGIVRIGKLRNFESFYNSENKSSAPKICNFGIVCPFDIPHVSQVCWILYLPFDINQFRRFNLSTFISYSSGKFLDWQIPIIIKFLQLFSFENYKIFKIWQFVKLSKFQKFPIW